mgnify:FL=1
MILILNCGSSSLKFGLIDENNEVNSSGQVENIGTDQPTLEIATGKQTESCKLSAINHKQAFDVVSDILNRKSENAEPIEAVGHRVVHGGELFKNPTKINDDVIAGIESCIPLAPLHNPASLSGIHAAQKRFPSIPHVAVFDTAFFSTMPPRAYLYAIPKELYTEKGIRRFGFHGSSHEYVARRCADLLRVDFARFSCITCHLGNGVSLSAVENGQCIDTTMGFTPLEGVAMGTRSGDIDPGLIFHLVREGMTVNEIENILQKQSGLLGLSGTSFDVRTLEQAGFEGDQDAQTALDVFAYRIRKALGGFFAALGHVDAVIFTGGIGQNSTFLRHHVVDGLESIGLLLDSVRNRTHNGQEAEISHIDGPVKIWIILTNEELMIAKKTRTVLNQDNDKT